MIVVSSSPGSLKLTFGSRPGARAGWAVLIALCMGLAGHSLYQVVAPPRVIEIGCARASGCTVSDGLSGPRTVVAPFTVALKQQPLRVLRTHNPWAVEVTARDGVWWLTGASSSAEQRQALEPIATRLQAFAAGETDTVTERLTLEREPFWSAMPMLLALLLVAATSGYQLARWYQVVIDLDRGAGLLRWSLRTFKQQREGVLSLSNVSWLTCQSSFQHLVITLRDDAPVELPCRLADGREQKDLDRAIDTLMEEVARSRSDSREVSSR